jgi:hypothetical protein
MWNFGSVLGRLGADCQDGMLVLFPSRQTRSLLFTTMTVVFPQPATLKTHRRLSLAFYEEFRKQGPANERPAGYRTNRPIAVPAARAVTM